ncbi:restriction endonuclease subunit S [Campylobacter concisus]|uniref:restriction endonuclease subunit S n=1 Tax=Campylobacter concisus TaxID=199 RepID=UPI00122D3A46|nr:restriction endonuclease subunit S [Campylobacter concisus]
MSEFKNLPSGWRVVRLGDVCEINPSSRKLPEKFYYIDLESVEKGILHSLKEVFLETAPSRAQRLLEKGDILFQMVRPYQKNNFLFELNGNFVASTGYAQIRTKQNRDFIFQYLNFDTFTKKVIEKCTGSNYPAINASVFSNLMILLPPVDEQEKIAEILSTWDEAINLTINLIENKKQFKKALMQNLLTAKIRFPQFQDEWKEIRLAETCRKINSNLTLNNLSSNHKFPTYDANGLVGYSDFFAFNREYITIVKDGAGVGRVRLVNGMTNFISTMMGIINRENSNIVFLNYIFKSINFNKFITGSTIPHIYFKNYSNIIIKLPNLNEQQKIAEVLTACDDEINLLNLKLENLKKQQQGLMQKLLSGNIRTKVKGGKNVKMDD